MQKKVEHLIGTHKSPPNPCTYKSMKMSMDPFAVSYRHVCSLPCQTPPVTGVKLALTGDLQFTDKVPVSLAIL